MLRSLIALTTFLGLGFSQTAVAGPLQLVGSEFAFPTGFYSIDESTAAISSLGTTTYSPGLDFRRDGVLFGASSRLYQIDEGTGTYSTVGVLPELMSSIAFNSVNELYGVSNDGLTLYQLDASSGSAISSVTVTGTVFRTGGSFPGEINGIDFGADGTLYGIGAGLYSIDTATGVATRITPSGSYVTGRTSTLFLDLDYGSDGMLRASSSTGGLYEIDPTTGLGSGVGSYGVRIYGLASPGSFSAVPEPSGLVLLGIGIVGVFGIGRHRSRRLLSDIA